MLSILPDLYTYQQFAPFILRAVAGFMFIYFAYLKFFPEREQRIDFFARIHLRPAQLFWGIVSVIELVGGVLLVLGLFTQLAALVLAVLMLFAVIIKLWRFDALASHISYYLLLFAVLVSLIFLGPGFWAFDYPL